MKISIIHPSRSRGNQAASVMSQWLSKADCRDNIEYRIIVDKDDKSGFYYQYHLGNRTLFFDNQRGNVVDAINFGALHSNGNLLIVVSDDFDCPDHWDTLLLKALQGKSDFCVKTQDGLQATLMTLPIMDRVYYERFGYIYHPDYRHMFCDQEMTAVAHMLGRAITLPLMFPHNHYSTGKFERDAVTLRNNATWQQGERVFNERLKSNFGIEFPVCKYSDIVWH
jgi:hypothetical protein